MTTRNGAKVEKVSNKYSVITSQFCPDFGDFVLVERMRTGRMRKLPLLTMVWQEDPEEVIEIIKAQGVAFSNRMALAA